MKIVGILLLLLGLFLTVAGFGAGLFFFMNPGPEFACGPEFDRSYTDPREIAALGGPSNPVIAALLQRNPWGNAELSASTNTG